MIDSYRVGKVPLERNRVHGIDDTFAGQTEIRLQGHTLPMPFVDDGEHPEFPPVDELVMYEIHRPVLAASRRRRRRPTVQADALSSTDSHTNLEPLQLVKPVDPLAAHLPALPGKQDVQTFVSEPRSCRRQFPQPLPQPTAVLRLRLVVPGGIAKAAERAGPADTELEALVDPSSDIPTPVGG